MSGSKPSSPAGASKAPRAPRATKTTEKTEKAETAKTPRAPRATTAKATKAIKATAAAKEPKAPTARAAKAPAPTANRASATSHRQQRTGKVVSVKMQKTIVVAIETLKRHPLYKRTYKSTNRLKAHDEHNDARLGDLVRIEETRPLSKEKRWRLIEILNRAAQAPSVEEVVAGLAPAVEN